MPEGLKPGMTLYRNIDAAFEKQLESRPCRREIDVALQVHVTGRFKLVLTARTADGRCVESCFHADVEAAENRERAEAMLREQLSKRGSVYAFRVTEVAAEGALPLLSASTLNGIRRLLAQDLDALPFPQESRQQGHGAVTIVPKAEDRSELMRSKYCIRYELGMCPIHQGAPESGPLHLLNNGRSFLLGFDCKKCEMTVKEERPSGKRRS